MCMLGRACDGAARAALCVPSAPHAVVVAEETASPQRSSVGVARAAPHVAPSLAVLLDARTAHARVLVRVVVAAKPLATSQRHRHRVGARAVHATTVAALRPPLALTGRFLPVPMRLWLASLQRAELFGENLRGDTRLTYSCLSVCEGALTVAMSAKLMLPLSNRCGDRQLDTLPKEPLRLHSLFQRHRGEEGTAARLPACDIISSQPALQLSTDRELVLFCVPSLPLRSSHSTEHLVQLAVLFVELLLLSQPALPLASSSGRRACLAAAVAEAPLLMQMASLSRSSAAPLDALPQVELALLRRPAAASPASRVCAAQQPAAIAPSPSRSSAPPGRSRTCRCEARHRTARVASVPSPCIRARVAAALPTG